MTSVFLDKSQTVPISLNRFDKGPYFDFYHKAGDEADKLNLKNMNQIIGTSAFTIANLLQKEAKLISLQGIENVAD